MSKISLPKLFSLMLIVDLSQILVNAFKVSQARKKKLKRDNRAKSSTTEFDSLRSHEKISRG